MFAPMFDGQYRSKPQVSLRGASKKVRTDLSRQNYRVISMFASSTETGRQRQSSETSTSRERAKGGKIDVAIYKFSKRIFVLNYSN